MMRTQRALLAITVACLIATFGTACAATPRAPTPAQLDQFREDGYVVVLLQIVVEDLEDPDGLAFKPFDHPVTLGDNWLFENPRYVEDNVRFLLGDFETGGVLQKDLWPRFVSVESRDQGWTYFLLRPETNYLGIGPGYTVFADSCRSRCDIVPIGQMAPRYVIDIPRDASVVYGGSVFIPDIERWLAFSSYTVKYNLRTRSQVRNHAAEAKQLAAEYFSELGPIQTVLIEPHTTDTYHLRTSSR